MRLEGFEPPTNGLEDPSGIPVECRGFGFLPAKREIRRVSGFSLRLDSCGFHCHFVATLTGAFFAAGT